MCSGWPTCWSTTVLPSIRPNPAHRRAKLLGCTEAGYWAVRRVSLVAHPWANRVSAELDPDDLATTLQTLQQLVGVLEHAQPRSLG